MRLDVLEKDIRDYVAKHPDCTREDVKRAFVGYERQYDVIADILERLRKQEKES